MNHRWFAGALVFAVLLRLLFLPKNSLWFDEAYSADQALKSFSVIFSGSDPRHPPLYYAFLNYWSQLFGQSEWSLRLPSAIASILNLSLVYQLGKRTFHQGVAKTAVLLLAFSPLDVWYAQEARMYMLVTSIGLLYALGLIWTSYWRVLPLSFTLIAGFYLDYTAIPLFSGITSIWLVYWWQKDKQGHLLLTWCIAIILAILAYLPWWPKFYVLLNGLSQIHIFAAFREFFNLPPIAAEQFLATLLLLTAGLFFAFNVLSTWLQKPALRPWITLIAAAGFVLALPMMVMPRFYTIKRVIVTGWPFVILFLAWLVLHVGKKEDFLKWGLTAVSLLATLVMLFAVGKDDWRSVAAYLDQHRGPNSVIWVDPRWNEIALSFYAPEAEIHRGDIAALSLLAEKEIWFVAERLPSQEPPSSVSEAWLDEQMELVDTITFFRLALKRYLPG